ncbi:hypothetical protein STEG23_028261, partial [Scotinomys teguina]
PIPGTESCIGDDTINKSLPRKAPSEAPKSHDALLDGIDASLSLPTRPGWALGEQKNNRVGRTLDGECEYLASSLSLCYLWRDKSCFSVLQFYKLENLKSANGQTYKMLPLSPMVVLYNYNFHTFSTLGIVNHCTFMLQMRTLKSGGARCPSVNEGVEELREGNMYPSKDSEKGQSVARRLQCGKHDVTIGSENNWGKVKTESFRTVKPGPNPALFDVLAYSQGF